MNRLLNSLLVSAAFTFAARGADVPATGPVYELRVYTVNPGKMPDLLKRFRDHTCALLVKHGMANVGYWLPVDKAEENKLYYVVSHQSLEAAKASWKAFGDDPDWKAVYAASEANGKLVTKVERTFLAPTDYSPALPSLTGAHIFELRIYSTNDGKLEALDARFRNHTMDLFRRHGMINVIYWHPTDPERGAGKTLVYLLAHDSREAAQKSWDAFRADAEWIEVRDESERAGKILSSPPQSIFLAPTDFSPLK